MELLKRKIDRYLLDWKNNPKRKPLIVKGARQIGKTESIRAFAKANYESVIEINFVLQKKFRAIFDDGYEVETIIKNISDGANVAVYPTEDADILRRAAEVPRLCHLAEVVLSGRTVRCHL